MRAHPSDRSEYMGVAELTVRVRILDKKQKADEDFFKKMAGTLVVVQATEKTSVSNLNETRARFWTESPGLWSYLVLKRFWIPLYQTSMFGLQNGRYLCSVATSGIKSHDKLAEGPLLGCDAIDQNDRKTLKKRPDSG